MDVGDSNGRYHGQLHLHAPLLSTRRFTGLLRLNTKRSDSDIEHGSDTSRRVPFLWERVPGTPKFSERPDHADANEPPPPPKLPPGRLHPPCQEGNVGNNDNNDNNNNKDEDDDDDDDAYLDAIDMMTFFESFSPEDRGAGGVSGLDSEAVQSSGNHSPSFIMNRFLPAANALANSSKSRKKATKKESSKHPSTPGKLSPGMFNNRAFSPPKSCGLEFFPWSLKQGICWSKSPLVPNCSFRKCNPPRDGGSGSKKTGTSRGDVGKCSERHVGRMESPCESWLSHAVSSVHERRG